MLTLLPPVACNRAGIGPGRGTRTIVRDRGSGEHAGYTLRVPGSAGGQPLTDLDPRLRPPPPQPEQLFAFDKQAGVRHLGAALPPLDSTTTPAWLGFALQRRGIFFAFYYFSC